MSIEKPYQPSGDELEKAEGVMTDEQKDASAEREATLQKGVDIAKKDIEDAKYHEEAEEMMTGDQRIMSEEREGALAHGHNEAIEEEVGKRLELAEEKIFGFLKENLPECKRWSCISCALNKKYEDVDIYSALRNLDVIPNLGDNDERYRRSLDDLNRTIDSLEGYGWSGEKGAERIRVVREIREFLKGFVATVNSAAESIGVTDYLSMEEVWKKVAKDDDSLGVNSILYGMGEKLKRELSEKR